MLRMEKDKTNVKKATLYIVAKWIILQKTINAVVNTTKGQIKYTIKQINSLEPVHFLKLVFGLRKEIPLINEKKKQILNGIIENIKKEFSDRNPCCLIVIEDIPIFDKKSDSTIPDFLNTRIEELIHSLSLIYATPVKPLFYIYRIEGLPQTRFYSFVDGINIKGYDEYFRKRNVKNLTEKYLLPLTIKLRDDEKLRLCLIMYKIILELPYPKLRMAYYWTMLEILAGQGFKNVYSFTTKYLNVDKKTLKMYKEMRGDLTHSGGISKNFDYNKESENLHYLFQDLIFAILEEKIKQNATL